MDLYTIFWVYITLDGVFYRFCTFFMLAIHNFSLLLSCEKSGEVWVLVAKFGVFRRLCKTSLSVQEMMLHIQKMRKSIIQRQCEIKLPVSSRTSDHNFYSERKRQKVAKFGGYTLHDYISQVKYLSICLSFTSFSLPVWSDFSLLGYVRSYPTWLG